MLPVLAVILAAVCFGTTGTAQALADVPASPIAVGAARILVGGALLATIAVLPRLRRGRGGGVDAGRAGQADPAPAPGDHPHPRLGPAAASAVLAVGALGVLAYQPLFFSGTRMNGVAVGTVIALGSAPIATGIIDAVLHRRAPARRWLVATVLTLAGVVLVSGLLEELGGGAAPISPLGVLASVGAGASYAAYTLAGKALLDHGWRSDASMGAMFGIAAAASLPVLLTAGAGWVLTPAGAGLTAWLGGVTTVIAYLLFGWGLGRLPAPVVSTLTIAEPLTATILGVAVLHEHVSLIAGAGMVVLLAGLLLLAVPVPRLRPAGSPHPRPGE
ncbi:MAG: EamA family transporter [Pseudoclavibacter sp.]